MIHRVKLNNEQVLLLEEGRVVKAGDFGRPSRKRKKKRPRSGTRLTAARSAGRRMTSATVALTPAAKRVRVKG